MNMLFLFMDALPGGTNASTQGTGLGNGMGGMWIMLILMFLIMYFFMIRPQNKKQKEIAKFRKMLVKGQSVITSGGIYGIVKEIEDSYVILEVAHDIRIKVDKNSIYSDPQQPASSTGK